MPDRKRIERLASLLMERGGKDALNQMRCGGKKYPGGGKFFRTNIEDESPLMYQPMMPVYPDVQAPLRYYPQPNYGDYEYPASTGMVQGMPIQAGYAVPVPRTGVLEEERLPVVVNEPEVDLFSDEAVARRALKQRWAESSFNDKAVSKAGAMGAWQIMPITLKDYMGRGRGKKGDLNDPEYNRKVRDWVMGIIPKDLQDLYSEDDAPLVRLAKIYGAYNWGAGNMRKYLRKKRDAGEDISNSVDWVEGLNPETRRYIKYLAFDEDIPDSTAYTNAAFEKAAADRGYFAGGGRLFRGGGPKKWVKDAVIGKAAKKVSEFSKGFLSADEVKTILEHPNDYASYLGWDAGKVNELKKNFYDNFSPWGYDLLAGLDALNGGNGQGYPIGTDFSEEMARDYLLANYLGIPEEDRKEPLASKMFEPSPYKPTIGLDKDKDFVRYSTDYNRNKIVDIYNGLMSNMRGVPGWKSELKPGREYWTSYLESPYRVKIGSSGKNLGVSRGGSYDFKSDPYSAALGQYTLGYGTDARRGDYISVYDKWDLNPFYMGSEYPLPRKLINTFASLGDASGGFGNPVNFYDRVYLDDYYGVDSRPQNPDEYYGGYILPSVVSSEKASGGKIHIKPENRGKFTALKKRTGHSASWFKAHGTPAQKKMAVFALNARKWKHGDGGLLHQYDGESEPTQQMDRVPNWTVRGTDYSTWKPSDIQNIIDWGYTDPVSFFGSEGESTRDALSRAGMADSVIGDIYANMDPALQQYYGDRYKGTAQRQEEYNQGIRDYTDYVAPRLAGIMAGSLLGAEGLSAAAPWMVDVAAPAVQKFMATPVGRAISTTFDTAGTIDGLRNAVSKNGVRKTIGFLKDHNYGRAALSGLGDVFDIAGGVGYARGAGRRFSEAVLRMGDEARSAGAFRPIRRFRDALHRGTDAGLKGTRRIAQAVKSVNDERQAYGHLSKQLLDKHTLNYIFNPYAGIVNPDLRYHMPYNYSGDSVSKNDVLGRHTYDRINDFLGNTQPENMEWVDVASLPEHIQDWARDRYPGMERIRVSHIGRVDNATHIPLEEYKNLVPGESISIRSSNGEIRRKIPTGPGAADWDFVSLLDPGHHGITFSMTPDGVVHAVGDDVYKYNAKDWLKKWKADFEGKYPEKWKTPEQKNRLDRWMDKRYGDDFSNLTFKGKLKYMGLKYVDAHGKPIIFKWDYPNEKIAVPKRNGEYIKQSEAPKPKAVTSEAKEKFDALVKDLGLETVTDSPGKPKLDFGITSKKPVKSNDVEPYIDDVTGEVLGFYDKATGAPAEPPSWWDMDIDVDAINAVNENPILEEVKNPPKSVAKKAAKKMTPEQEKQMQEEILKQVKETWAKMQSKKAASSELPFAEGGSLERVGSVLGKYEPDKIRKALALMKAGS